MTCDGHGVTTGTYTIGAGDTLSKIAKQYNTTVEELAKLNDITDKNKIMAGAVLTLPASNSADTVTLNTETQASDGTISDETQTKNDNMKNLKTAYDTILANIDTMELPDGVDRNTFKEKLAGGYQGKIMSNDLPDTLATSADFAVDLISNAFTGCGTEVNWENVVKYSAELFPDGKIGDKQCSDLSSKSFKIVDVPDIGMMLQFDE